jgi:hypothetical protein
MKNVIQLKQSNFIKYLLIYFVIMLIGSYIKTTNVVNFLVTKSVDVVLITSHISSVISSIFIILLLIIIITTCYFLREIFFKEINLESIFASIKSVILIFILTELFRILLIYFILIDEIRKIDTSENIVQQLNDTDWYHYNSLINPLGAIKLFIIFDMNIGGLTTSRY